MVKRCDDYYKVRIDGVVTAVHHSYTRITSIYSYVDGTLVPDDVLERIEDQLIEENLINVGGLFDYATRMIGAFSNDDLKGGISILPSLEQSYIDELGLPDNIDDKPYDPDTNNYEIGRPYIVFGRFNDDFTFEYNMYSASYPNMGHILKGLLSSLNIMEDEITALDERLTTAEEDIDDLETRMDTAETDIDNLEGRMDTAETDIDNLEGRMDTAETDIDNLEGRMDTAETDIETLGTRMDSAEDDITALEGRMDQAEGDIETVRAIAQGKNTGYVFQDEAEMNEWLSDPANTEKLKAGDSFFIVDLDVPDYWWDGTQAQVQEGPKVDLTPYATIGYVNAELAKRDVIIQQCLFITLDHEPDDSDTTYVDTDGETYDFSEGAVVKYVDSDGNAVFYKLVELGENGAVWTTIIDARFGNVTLETTYDKDYRIVNVTSGSALTGISSDVDYLKIVNSAAGNITITFDAAVSGGAVALTSPLASSTLVLTPGSSATFTKTQDKYKLTQLFGVTVFPDLADANRDGEWAMTVGPDGRPVLMEVVEMRKWDETIVTEQTIDQLNERFPDVEIGFAVVCKTINKVYEKVNGYNEWVSYDITSIS